jgi:GNAT superfamily N-acetyltransferase
VIGFLEMAEILVREAVGTADMAAVRRLLGSYGEFLEALPNGAHISIENYAQELETLPGPYAALLLASVNGAAAGCVALKPIPEAAVGERACELKRLWVGAEFRGLKLGQRLVQEAIAWGKRNGYSAMYLDTVPAAFPDATRIYRTMGFVPVKRYNDNPLAGVAFFRFGFEASEQENFS